MATREIRREEWKAFFNQFSKKHENSRATVSQFGEEIGSQEVIHDMSFVGISADTKAGENDIVVMLGSETADHVQHVINAPANVWLRESESEGSSEWVEIIQSDNSKVVVEVKPAPELAAV